MTLIDAPLTTDSMAMSEEEARLCVNEIKNHMERARVLLLRLYEGRGWHVLGYSSWRECVTAEFRQGQSYLYRQLRAGQIEQIISPIGEIGSIPESQIRPLTFLSTDLLPEAYKEAKRRADDRDEPLTANIVQEVVTEFKEQQTAHAEPIGMEPIKPSNDLELFSPRTSLPMLPPVKERGLYLPTPEEVDAIRSASASTFNKQNSDNIEWARWSWNPVTGCLHGCDYCYARDIAARFYEQGFTPTFIPERLSAPRNTKPPRLSDDTSEIDRMGWTNVFVCSMADLWGKWVPSEIIRYILREAHEQPQWNYLYLTKFPARYEEFATEFPSNTWVGTSVDAQHAVHRAEKAFRKLADAGHQGVRWLSCEPLMERVKFTSLEMFDWVIIGGSSRSSQTPEFHPPFDWIVDLYQQARDAGCKVYFKTNLFGDGNRVREYPQ